MEDRLSEQFLDALHMFLEFSLSLGSNLIVVTKASFLILKFWELLFYEDNRIEIYVSILLYTNQSLYLYITNIASVTMQILSPLTLLNLLQLLLHILDRSCGIRQHRHCRKVGFCNSSLIAFLIFGPS